MNSVPSFLDRAMIECISLAHRAAAAGNYPLGAAVVSPEKGIISAAQSSLIHTCDPTAHPEVVVIREAASIARSRYLPGLYLVSTMEPCPMCTAAVIWAKMDGIAFGTRQKTAKAWGQSLASATYTFRQIDIPSEYVAARGEPKIRIYDEVREAECDALLKLVR